MRKIVLLLTLLVACGDSRLSPQGGTITSVSAGSGATGGGTGGAVTVNVIGAVGGGLSVLADSIGMLTTCTSTQVLAWNGTSWACSTPAVGDITGVTVTSPACSAGSFVATLTGGAATGDAPVGGTCVAEVGDISAATVTANMGLQGGGTSGAVAFGLLSTCADGQVLKAGGTGTTWTCANDTTGGGITNSAGANVVMKSNGTNAVASSITDTGTAVAVAVGTTINSGFAVDRGTSGAAAAVVGTNVEIEGAAATNNYITLRTPSADNGGILFSTPTSGTDGYMIYNGSLGRLGFAAGGLQNLQLTGTLFTVAVATTITPPNGGNAVALTINDAATGQTDNGHNINTRISGSYDTTLGNLYPVALEAIVTSTRSAGANALTNIGIYSSVTGGQSNIGLWVDDGTTLLDGTLTVAGMSTLTGGFNSSAGTSTVGDFRGTVISPSATGTLNDWAPTGIGTATVIDIAPTGGIDLTGISGGALGRIITVRNANGIGYTVVIYHETGSLAANRFDLDGATHWTLMSGDSMTFVYTAGGRWASIGHSGRKYPGLYLTGDLAMGGASITGSLNYTGTGTIQGARITSETQLHDFQRGTEFFEEFLSEPADGGNWQVNGAAGVSTSGYALNRPGVLFLKTEASGVGAGLATVAVFQGDDLLGEGSSWYAGGGVTEFEVSGMFEVSPTTTPSFEVAMGLMSTNVVSNSNEGVYCKATAGSANWQACTAENAVATCADTSPVVAKAINNWVRCSAVVNAAGTSVTFTIKDITTGTTGTLTQTATIPDNILYQAGLSFVNNRVGTTGGGFFFADYAWFNQTFTTAR